MFDKLLESSKPEKSSSKICNHSLFKGKKTVKKNYSVGFEVIRCILGWVIAFFFLYVFDTNVHITSCILYQNYQIKILEICGLIHKKHLASISFHISGFKGATALSVP